MAERRSGNSVVANQEKKVVISRESRHSLIA
jgi:hypothetical protein